jgi:hypothetical protein
MGTLPLLFALAITPSANADSGACTPADAPAAGTVSDLQDAVDATEDKPKKPALGDSWLNSIGSWGSKVSEGVSNAVSDLQSQLAPTAEERAAIELVHAMLAPDKLGGNDTTFNQNDLDRIVASLLQDPAVQQQIVCGIRQEAFRQAEDAPGLIRGLARRIADNRTTPGTRAYDKHYGKYWQQGLQEAAQKIRGELTQALESEDIAPIPGQGTSGVERDLTLGELEKFQAAVGTLQAYGDKVAEKLGAMDNDIPHGLSQAKLESILGMLPAPPK